jgi:superoxide dismutase
VYQRAKEAQLQPGDLNTLQNVYPKLHQQMVNKAGDAIVDHKTQGLELPKHARRGLGMLMQQNLGFCQTPTAMQAIISANAPSEPPRKDKGTPAKAVDESNKQAQIEATADQSRRLDRKTQ